MIERERYGAGGRAAASLGRAARGGPRPILFATATVLLAAAPVTLALSDPYMLALRLGIGHAVLTDGALDGSGTPLLVGYGALGLAGVGVAHGLRRRRTAQP